MKFETKTGQPVWLQLSKYRVVPLKPALARHIAELERAIQYGVAAYRDLTRLGFFEVELENGRFYIHVYEKGHAVYLIAELPKTPSLPARKIGRVCRSEVFPFD